MFSPLYSIFYDCNLLVYWWNWMIQSSWKKSLESVSFLRFCLFSTFFHFHCILPVPTPQYTIILLLLQNITLRCCCYTCTEHLTSRYVKEIHLVFLVCWISAIFLPIFWHFVAYSSHFYPGIRCLTHTTHNYFSHWTCNHTWIASTNVIFCISCYYHSHLIMSYFAHILGFWVMCGVKMMWLCHGWGWPPPQNSSHIHIRYVQSVWAHWYNLYWHTVAALHSFTHSNRLRFWGSGSIVVVE